MFNTCGQIIFAPGTDEDTLMEIALESGAEDVVSNEDGSFEVITTPEDFGTVKDALDAAGLESVNAEVTRLAENQAELSVSDAEKLLRLVDAMEDLDDTQNIYHNGDIPDEALSD